MRDFQYEQLNRESLKFRLYQIGGVSDVYKRKHGASDRLNNDEIIFEKIGETILFRHFQSTTKKEQNMGAGEVETVNPSFTFPHDSIIESNCTVFYLGEEYFIDSKTERGNHIDAESQLVETLTNPDTQNITVLDESGNEQTLPIQP